MAVVCACGMYVCNTHIYTCIFIYTTLTQTDRNMSKERVIEKRHMRTPSRGRRASNHCAETSSCGTHPLQAHEYVKSSINLPDIKCSYLSYTYAYIGIFFLNVGGLCKSLFSLLPTLMYAYSCNYIT